LQNAILQTIRALASTLKFAQQVFGSLIMQLFGGIN
jgi:hypothetical protein